MPKGTQLTPGRHTPISISEHRDKYRALANYIPTAGGPRKRAEHLAATPEAAYERCRASLLDQLSTDEEAAP